MCGVISDSVYDLATERRRADERASDTQWARRFPHERGNWPTHVFIPGEFPVSVGLQKQHVHFETDCTDGRSLRLAYGTWTAQ